MRAWLLLLAVLATFQPFVQVASTEDITSRFIQAISPSIKQQQQPEDSRETRRTFNTQQLAVTNKEATNVTAISPVNDITSLSVTTSSSTVARLVESNAATVIATIYSSDSDKSNNNSNNLNKISEKDNRESKSDITSDALKAIVDGSEVKQKHKINKQIQNQNQNHNEVNDKSANSANQQNSAAVRTLENRANKVKQLEYTSDQQSKIATTKSTRKEAEQILVSSVNEEAEKSVENHFSKMAIEENTIATAPDGSSKQHRRHRQQQQDHQQHPHHRHQQQRHQHHLNKNTQQTHQHSHQHHHQHQQHKTAHSAEAVALKPFLATEKHQTITEERLAATEETSAMHQEAAEKLAQQSARTLDDSISSISTPEYASSTQLANASVAATFTSSTSSTASVNDDTESGSDNSESDSNSDSEPATYSNKEIIGEKLKPDPSTLVQIENSLLSLFNMKRPPKIDRSKIIIPEAMKQLYAQIMGHELDTVMIPRPGILTKSANTVRSFTHIESKIDDRFPHHHRFRLYFDVKSIPTEEKLKAAELQLSRDAISDAVLNERLANRTRYQVLVYDITRVGVRGKREPSYLLLDNKSVRLNSTETVSLGVQPAVDRWLATPKKNYGLLIEVRTSRSLKPAPHHHVRLRRSVDEPQENWQHKQPVLYAYTDDGKHKSRSIRDTSSRSKRAGHHRRAHRRKNSDEICRRHSLYVDFADVGWSDWIVAPPGYDAFYCQGKCPFPLAEHMNSTNHAVVQTLVNNLNPGKVPKACCVPTQLEGISMLYLNDQNTVVLKNYQDMTVVGCGCR